MNIFAVDLGNSSITAALYNPHEGWTSMKKIPSTKSSTAAMEDFLTQWPGEQRKSVHCVSLSSVVPTSTNMLKQAIRSCFHCPILLVRTKLKSAVQKDIPDTLGTDLFANAVSAYNKAKGEASITVDFGTALSFTVVNRSGKIAGVAIGLGISSSLESLVGKTALLNTFELTYPQKTLGTTDESAIQSALVLGNFHLIRGLCLQMQEELGEACTLYATGGNSMLYSNSKLFDQIDPFHTLDGLRILAEYNHQ